MEKIDDIKEIQKIELDILKFIHRICQENNLTYYLSDGTLIGAIRHKGFIPWDDDLDISMPRPDYEKLIKIMRKVKDNTYALKCIENGKEKYNYTFAKMVDTRTVAIEEDKFQDEELGIWVDIFPLDGLGNNLEKAEKCIQKNKRFVKQILNLEAGRQMNFKGRILYLLGRKRLNRILKWSMKKSNFYKSKYVTAIGWINPSIVMDGPSYQEKIYVDFEDNKFSVPKGYDTILKQQYGDYMQLPPKDEQQPSHGCDRWWKQK